MQTKLSPEFMHDPDARQAAAAIKQCVHCGFCNATCPTYQVLGDELDGPRGRIYLVKQMLEGAAVTRSTQQHLDRCLTCLNCETTCPSGVPFARLIDSGRALVAQRVTRPGASRVARALIRDGLTSSWFAPALRAGRALRPLLPKLIKDKIPASRPMLEVRALPSRADKILLLRGCVQPALMPNIDAATIRVLDAAGIEVVQAQGTGCCGALRTHLDDHSGGLDDMRRNVDLWDPLLEDGRIQAIVSSASACALAIKNYRHALAGDARYRARAERISAMARDLSELLPVLAPRIRAQIAPDCSPLAFHAPCTLQHGQKLRGLVEAQLQALGLDVQPPNDAHLCCGSAGAYSLLQPTIANELRERKLSQLQSLEPACILSANVGCIQHLQSGTSTPVRHWIEWLADHLRPS